LQQQDLRILGGVENLLGRSLPLVRRAAVLAEMRRDVDVSINHARQQRQMGKIVGDALLGRVLDTRNPRAFDRDDRIALYTTSSVNQRSCTDGDCFLRYGSDGKDEERF